MYNYYRWIRLQTRFPKLFFMQAIFIQTMSVSYPYLEVLTALTHT